MAISSSFGSGERVLSTASLRLGRLAASVERSPVGALWRSRETALAVSKLFSRGAAPIAPWELMELAAGLSSSAPRIEENAARRFWVDAGRLWSRPPSTARGPTIPEITKELQALQAEGMPPGDLAVEAPLRLAEAAGLSVPSLAAAIPPEASSDWQGAMMAAIAAEAEASYERLLRLEQDFSRWSRALPPRREDSRLGDVLVLLGTTYSLTPRFVVEALGVTRQAAARLLRQLEEAGIVEQAARRQRWLIYLASNTGRPGVPDSTRRSTLREIEPISTEAIDETLSKAYAALERTVRWDALDD
jgi:hypothetical protein